MANEQDPITITEENTDFEITTEEAGEGSLAEEIIEALFDDGSTTSDVTYADTDGDGKIDAGAADPSIFDSGTSSWPIRSQGPAERNPIAVTPSGVSG